MKAGAPLASRPMPGHGDERPLVYPSVPGHNLAPINRFHGSRWRLRLQLGGRPIELSAAAPAARAAESDCLAVSLAVGGEEAVLLLPPRLVTAALDGFGAHVDATALDPGRKALLIEAAFAEALAELEARLGESVELRAPSGSAGPRFPVAVTLANASKEIGEIAGPAALLSRLFALLPASAERPEWLAPIPVPLSLRHAEVRLTLGELGRARPGDVLLFDKHLPAGEACLLAGRNLVAPVKIGNGAARLHAAPVPARSSRWEWLMDDLDDDAAAPEDAAALDDLPVRVIFEFGRSEMSLKELAGLGAGSVVALATPPGEPLSLIVNGRRIGQGEPVRIGEALGVRITRLFDA